MSTYVYEMPSNKKEEKTPIETVDRENAEPQRKDNSKLLSQIDGLQKQVSFGANCVELLCNQPHDEARVVALMRAQTHSQKMLENIVKLLCELIE